MSFLSQAGAKIKEVSNMSQEQQKETVQQAFGQFTGSGRDDGYQHSFNQNSAASWEAGIWDGYSGKERDDLYASLDMAYNNAGSTLYNPYRHATNTEYTDTLKKYGLDVPDVITADWINEQWGIYGGSLRKKDDGSLGKARNKNEQIARALYGLEGIEYTTQKAEKELDDIRQTVNWYATHGYSQDYIAKVVGGMKHSTLDSIAITRDPKAIESTDDDGYTISTKRGTTVGLNRSVYFDDDILTGMYWKAINGVDDVSDFDAAVYAYQNKGRLRGGSKRLDDMRTYGNPNYNPHNDGCTNIEAKMAFGQDEFTYDDILRLRAETDENDTKRMSLIKKLFDNETRTANAEKELTWLNGRVSGFDYNIDIPEGKDPRKYFEERVDSWLNTGGSDAEGLSNLKTMDKRREQGNPMDINRSINYRKEDVVDAMMARYNAAHGISTDPRAELAQKQPETEKPAAEAEQATTPEQAEPEQPGQSPKKDDSVYNVQVGGHYVQVPAYDKDGNRMTEEEAMQAYIDSKNGSSSGGYTAPALPDTPTNYERRDDKEMQDWVDSHTTDSFDPNFVMKVPSSRGNWDGTVAAGGAVSDQPTWYKGKNDTRPQEVYVVTDKEGAQEFTSADLLHIMNAAYSGKGDQLTEEERRMGEGLINSIPWAFGDSLQWLGTNGEFDSGAMRRMDKTAQALGEDLRNVRNAASSYYATSGEKADIAVRFFEDALAASNVGMDIAEWYSQTEEGQQRKQELLDEAAGINQRADEIKAENDEKERQAKREALAINLTIMQASPDQLDENGRAAADQMTLRPGEADSILAMPEAKDTWDKEGRAFVDYVGANFATPYQEALNNDDLAGAQDIVRRFMGFPEGTNVDGISEDMFNAEQLGIIEVAKQLYAQDAKIAMASGMTLDEYYGVVGHRTAEDLMHASFQYRQLMNSEDSISDEAKQGIGILATVWNGMKLGAIDVAANDVGFVADIANILTSPGDFESLSTRYTNRYGFFQGRSQYRNDVDTMLAWWESQDDEASQQKAAEYREKMKLIDENGLDIFNLGFNPDTDLLDRVRKQVNDEIAATQDWIDQYATDAEKHGVQIIRSATGSTIQQTRAMALSAVTGIPTGLATTMSFLPGSFEGHMQDTEGRGWSDTRRYMYAMIGGLMDAALEGEFSSKYYNMGGDMLSGFLKDGATKFAATHGITGLGSHLVYGLMVYAGNSVGEISQEVLQNVAGGIYDYLWTGNDKMLRDSVARDTMIDTILSTALSTFMSTTAHQAGQAASGAPSIFSNRYRITTAAMLEFSPELREAAHELFSAGSIYNRGDDVLDLVTEGSRQSAMTRAGEIGEVMPDRSMPEPTQANELNSAGSVTEEEQAAPEQGPQIPTEAPVAEPQTEQPAAPVEEAPVEALATEQPAAPVEEAPTEAPAAPAEEAPVEEAPTEAPAAEPQTEQVEQPAAPAEEAPASNLSPEMQLFVEKAGAWFRNAKTQVADLMNQAADQNITEEQKATLEHQIQTIQSRITDASFEIMDRLTKMDIHLKTAELMRNPEAVADMVKFTASQRVASKIAAGALTAKPSTKEKLSTKLETAEAADAANKAAEMANANAQQAGADLAAARDANRENPTPENAKREVNAAKKKVDADRQAEQARKEADDANTAAQKAEEDLNSELQSNLEAIRQEATDDATAEVQQLQQTVGDSLETALEEDSVTKVDLPPIDPEVTVNKSEAQTPAEPQTEGPAPDLQERLNTLKSRLQNLNTDGKKGKLNGNRYLQQAIVDAAAADANVESYLTSLDDAGIQNLLRQSKAAGITKGKAAAWLRGLVREDAAARGVTIEADAYTEAKDNLKAATESVVNLKLVPAAQLVDPARTVQTVLTEQYQQLSALKNELETAQRNGTDAGDLPDRIKAARTEIATTMDAASVVLRHWDKANTKYMGTPNGAFEALDKETWSGSRAAQAKADRFDSTANDLLTDINNLVTNGSKVVPGKSDGFHDYRMPYQLPRAGVERRNAPTGTQQPGAFNPPSRSPIEIFQKLGNDLGIGTYSSVRNMPQGHNVPATTNERRGYILSARYHSNEAWALYHEIGHNIQERTQMATTQDMINGMDPATRAQYTGAELNAEAYAEFVASYVSGTANAFYAPSTVSDFENSLRRAGIYRQVQEARTAQAAYGTATPLERIAAHMKYENHRDERPTATGQAIRNAMRKAGIGMVDDTMAAARFDTASGLSRNDSLLSIQQQAKLMKGDAQRSIQLIVGNLTTLGGRYLREGFADATEGFTEEQLRMTDAYMSAVHALDRANVAIQRELSRVNDGLPRQQWRALTANETQHALEQAQVFNSTYNSLNDIQNAIDTTRRNHPEVVAAADQRISWWHDFMQEYAVNTHLLTQNQLDTMERDYPHYAPMYRVGKEGGDLFHELTGSDRDIMAPTVGYVHNINAIVERGRRNAVLESIYNELLSEPDGDGLGLFVRVADGNEASNTTSFTDATGETHYLQFEDEDLFKMITSNATPAQVRGGLRGVAKFTRAMAMFTTGSNPLFAAKNFVRDFQQGVNHGSWAATYLDGAVKWFISGLELAGSQLSSTRLAQRIAETNLATRVHLDNAIDRMANRSHAAEYRALNGSDEYTHHGLPRGERKILTTDADQLLSMFTTDTESRPKKLWNTAWNLLTFDAVNGWVEQTTRFAEYRFGRHDLDTEVGRQKAYLAAQESTTNFSLSGKSQLAADLRAIIPFFNATLQGTYSALHSFSEAERDRLPARITKTIVNNVLAGALAYGLLEKYGSDDDKEWYEKLAEGLKTDNIIIPFGALENFLGQDNKEHPRQFIRIPLTQNPFGKLFYNVGRIMLHDKIGGESLMDLTGVVQAILSEATQLDPITNPLVNVWMNKTYYGSNIVPNYLLTTYDGKKIPPVEHTNDSTAYAFEVLARVADQIPLFNNGVTNDPMKMQYLFQQYTGFIGKLAIPFFTGTRATGYNSGGAEVAYNLMDILRKDWTADAAYSNDFNDAFHDYEEAIESIVSYGGSRGKAPGLNQLLSQEEQQEALDVGTYLTGPTGPLTVLGKEISDLYNQQSKIYENEALSYDDRQIQARDIQKMIVNKQIEGLAICKEYASKYMGQTFSMDYALYGAKQGLEKNPTASFPRVLDATKDGKHPGMQRALEVYKRANGDPNMTASSYNPSPYAAVQLTKSTKVPLYAMPTACAEQYQDTFVESIETSLGGIDWDSMDPGEQETVVKKAVSTAKTAARKAVLSYYDLNGLMPTD